MNGPVVVREPDDLTVAAELLVAFNHEYDDPAPEPAWLARHLQTLIEQGTASVLVIGRPRVGVAVMRFRTSTWADEPEAYLAEFYVSPAERGHGLGRVLLGAVLDHARHHGATYIDLNTSEDDEAARHLYEAFGFDCHEGRGHGPRALYYELDL